MRISAMIVEVTESQTRTARMNPCHSLVVICTKLIFQKTVGKTFEKHNYFLLSLV